MKIHIIIHESFESPAAIETWALNNNHDVSYTRLYEHQELPDNSDAFDYLIIMGGPQSPATTVEECPHFDAQAEIALIADAIKKKKFILGVCLGAQLIGEAYGVQFEQSPNREIGVFEVELTAAGKADPLFSKFPNKFLVGHWHNDMPGVPETAQILAHSAGCPRQIVKYDHGIYGFQCHFEFTVEAITGMLENCADEVVSNQSLPYVQSPETLISQDYDAINSLLFDFLDGLE